MSCEDACQEFRNLVNDFARKTAFEETLENLDKALEANGEARRSLEDRSSQEQLQNKAIIVGGGACCFGLLGYSAAAATIMCTLKASAAATNPCMAPLTKAVHTVTTTKTHTSTVAGYFTRGTRTSHTVHTTVTKVIYQRWAKQALDCFAGLGSLFSCAGLRGCQRMRECSSSHDDAKRILESVRKGLQLLQEEWNGLHMSCKVLMSEFQAPAPPTLTHLAEQCGPQLNVARDCIEKFLVMMWMTQSMPASIHENISQIVGEDRFLRIRDTFSEVQAISSGSQD